MTMGLPVSMAPCTQGPGWSDHRWAAWRRSEKLVKIQQNPNEPHCLKCVNAQESLATLKHSKRVHASSRVSTKIFFFTENLPLLICVHFCRNSRLSCCEHTKSQCAFVNSGKMCWHNFAMFDIFSFQTHLASLSSSSIEMYQKYYSKYD